MAPFTAPFTAASSKSAAVIPCKPIDDENEIAISFVGDVLGEALGDAVGLALGETLGLTVGDVLGEALGDAVGLALGDAVGLALGETLGLTVGDAVTASPLPNCRPAPPLNSKRTSSSPRRRSQSATSSMSPLANCTESPHPTAPMTRSFPLVKGMSLGIAAVACNSPSM